MAAELNVSSSADDDVVKAYAWYERQRSGLGEEFLSCVEDMFESILFNPDQFERLHGHFRRATVSRFPYAIYFESSDGTVTVYGVIHHSRDEHIWRDRLSLSE
jgi:hypothetical protein